MLLKNYKPILHLFFFALASYILHKIVFIFFDIPNQNFYYSLESLYLIFFSFSSVFFIVLLKFTIKNFDSTGMMFMMGTLIQMFFCYLVLRPILNEKIHNVSVEKTNFFITFILFLLFETLITVRLLNEKR
ncbi:hypothetical protein DMB65_16920 [Flavobacterium cheongpyeongense]|uniref:Uncharacterized protein n=1 Tax=Flavobacterium cheongpyeongense TaxID=2212651 RepID=A0A2V4BL52_9FLAO|nr:hypothetical protein DMB65_16920 [Flavobacterium cheongpyeongense]